jgi:hypothetical protein
MQHKKGSLLSTSVLTTAICFCIGIGYYPIKTAAQIFCKAIGQDFAKGLSEVESKRKRNLVLDVADESITRPPDVNYRLR